MALTSEEIFCWIWCAFRLVNVGMKFVPLFKISVISCEGWMLAKLWICNLRLEVVSCLRRLAIAMLIFDRVVRFWE